MNDDLEDGDENKMVEQDEEDDMYVVSLKADMHMPFLAVAYLYLQIYIFCVSTSLSACVVKWKLFA